MRRKAAATLAEAGSITVLMVDDRGIVRDGLRCVFAPRADLNAAAAELRGVLEANARSYTLRDAAIDAIVKAVRTLSAGAPERRQGGHEGAVPVLTATETEILRLVADGNSNSRVAQRLGLSPRTVEAYRLRLMRKLGIGHLPALVKYAIRHGITQIE